MDRGDGDSYVTYTPFLEPHGDILEIKYYTFRISVEKVDISIPIPTNPA